MTKSRYTSWARNHPLKHTWPIRHSWRDLYGCMTHLSHLLIYLFIIIIIIIIINHFYLFGYFLFFIYLFIILLFIYLFIIIILSFSNLFIIHLFNLIIWCFCRKIYQRRKKNFEIGKTLKRKGIVLGVSKDQWRVKIGMKKFLEKMGLLTWYAWIDFFEI